MVMKRDGSVWTTGRNSFGQLGMGLLCEDRITFHKVIESSVKAVDAGALHSLVVRQHGSVWDTGRNLFGQLGDGSTVARIMFVLAYSQAVQRLLLQVIRIACC